MKKEHARNRVKTQKALLTAAEKAEAAARVFEQLENNAAFVVARNILMYHSLPDELSTREFIDRWHTRKNFFLPRVNGLDMEILPFDRSRLALGAFHIEEPMGDETTDVADMELIVVPGVAFDRKGNRVGRGKGYYDRLLPRSKAVKVGVGYDFQLIDEDLETEPHDARVDVVITRSTTITIRKTNK